MLIRRVVRHPVEQEPHAALVAAGDQIVEVGVGAEDRIDAAVVGDVVAEVAHRRGEDRRQPERVDAEVGQVVELVGDARQVADAITVRVGERPWIDLVDDGLTPPRSTHRDSLHAPTPKFSWRCAVSAHAQENFGGERWGRSGSDERGEDLEGLAVGGQ